MYRCDLILCKTLFSWQPFWISVWKSLVQVCAPFVYRDTCHINATDSPM